MFENGLLTSEHQFKKKHKNLNNIHIYKLLLWIYASQLAKLISLRRP